MEEIKTEEKQWCIYMHTNKHNNKVYIGITHQNPIRRWGTQGQGYKTQKYFWRAIQKYGWDGFEHIIFEENLMEDDAKYMEKKLIKLYNADNKEYGYNISPGGDGGCAFGERNPFYGRHHTQETKDKISKSQRARYENLEERKRLSNAAKERFKNPEMRKKYSDSAKKRFENPEEKNRMKEIARKRCENFPGLTSGENNANAKLVLCLDTGIVYGASSVAYRETNIHSKGIRNCCNLIANSAGGFKWRFVYDTIRKDGTFISGAITLGLITEEEALKQLAKQNDLIGDNNEV